MTGESTVDKQVFYTYQPPTKTKNVHVAMFHINTCL